jgi:uncharacterized membrane protein YccC
VALGVTLPLLIGVATGELRYAGFAAVGALCAGLASFAGSTRNRVAAVLISSAGMAVTTFIGAATAATASWLLIPTLALMGLVVGAAVEFEPPRAIAALMWPIALLVADAVPLDPSGAAARAGWVLAGGTLQALLVTATWAIGPGRQEARAVVTKYRQLAHYTNGVAHGHLEPPPLPAVTGHALPADHKLSGSCARTTRLLCMIDIRTETGRHAIRLAVAAAAGQAVALAIHPSESHWIPLTIFVVLQPNYQSTLSRGLQRAVGTMLGAGLGAAIVGLDHLSLAATAIVASICIATAYGLFQVSYGLYSLLLTAFVVVLFDYLGISATTSAPARILDTLIGAAIALVSFFVWPTWPPRPRPRTPANTLGAHAPYGTAQLTPAGQPNPDRRGHHALQTTARSTRPTVHNAPARNRLPTTRPPVLSPGQAAADRQPSPC